MPALSGLPPPQAALPPLPLPLPQLHNLVYTVSTIETMIHQFIDRELLQETPSRRREAGARLQALERGPRLNRSFHHRATPMCPLS